MPGYAKGNLGVFQKLTFEVEKWTKIIDHRQAMIYEAKASKIEAEESLRQFLKDNPEFLSQPDPIIPFLQAGSRPLMRYGR